MTDINLERELEAGNDNGCAGCLTASAKHPCLGHGCTDRCILHRVEYAEPLTADTISDEQIRALRGAAGKMSTNSHTARALIMTCNAALRGLERAHAARGECADAINKLNAERGKT